MFGHMSRPGDVVEVDVVVEVVVVTLLLYACRYVSSLPCACRGGVVPSLLGPPAPRCRLLLLLLIWRRVVYRLLLRTVFVAALAVVFTGGSPRPLTCTVQSAASWPTGGGHWWRTLHRSASHVGRRHGLFVVPRLEKGPPANLETNMYIHRNSIYLERLGRRVILF